MISGSNRFGRKDFLGVAQTQRNGPSDNFAASCASITICEEHPDQTWRFRHKGIAIGNPQKNRNLFNRNKLRHHSGKTAHFGMRRAFSNGCITTSKEPSMSKQSRIIKPETNEIPKELLDLATVIAELPAEHLEKVEPALEKVVESTKRRRKILSLVQDALSQLRLDMKYLAFDLEATRRERDDYRRQLEETS